MPISFNFEGYRLYERLSTYYLEYHKLVSEALEYLEADLIVNMHTHDPESSKIGTDVIVYCTDYHSAILKNIES